MAETTVEWPTIGENTADDLLDAVFENWDDGDDSDKSVIIIEEEDKQSPRHDTEPATMQLLDLMIHMNPDFDARSVLSKKDKRGGSPATIFDARSLLFKKDKRGDSHSKKDQDVAVPKQSRFMPLATKSQNSHEYHTQDRENVWPKENPHGSVQVIKGNVIYTSSNEYRTSAGPTESLTDLQVRANVWAKEKPHGSVQVIKGNVIHTSVPSEMGCASPYQGTAIGQNDSDQQKRLNLQIQEAKQRYLVDKWIKNNINNRGNQALKEIPRPVPSDSKSIANNDRDATKLTKGHLGQSKPEKKGSVFSRLSYPSESNQLDAEADVSEKLSVLDCLGINLTSPIATEKLPIKDRLGLNPKFTAYKINEKLSDLDEKDEDENSKPRHKFETERDAKSLIVSTKKSIYDSRPKRDIPNNLDFVKRVCRDYAILPNVTQKPTAKTKSSITHKTTKNMKVAQNPGAETKSSMTQSDGFYEKFVVPLNKADLLMGKGGEIIYKIMVACGAHFDLIHNPNELIFKIYGLPMQVYEAKVLISRLAKMNIVIPRPKNMNDNSVVVEQSGNTVNESYAAAVASNVTYEEKFEVPFKMAGFVIGKGGETINKIMTESEAYINLDNSSTTKKIFTIRGNTMQIHNAKLLIAKAAKMTDFSLEEWKTMKTCWFFNFVEGQCEKSPFECKKLHQCCVCEETDHGKITCPVIGPYHYQQTQTKTVECSDLFVTGDQLPTLEEWKTMKTCWFFNFIKGQCEKSSSECKKLHQCCVCGDTGHGKITCPVIGPYQQTQTKTGECSDFNVTGDQLPTFDVENAKNTCWFFNFNGQCEKSSSKCERLHHCCLCGDTGHGKITCPVIGPYQQTQTKTVSDKFMKGGLLPTFGLEKNKKTCWFFNFKGECEKSSSECIKLHQCCDCGDTGHGKLTCPGIGPYQQTQTKTVECSDLFVTDDPTMEEWKTMKTCWFFNFMEGHCEKSSSKCKRVHQCCICGDTGHGKMNCPVIGPYQQTQTKTVECSDLFVTGLSPTMRDNELLEYFKLFGKVYNFQIQKDNVTGQSKGIALKFFELADQERVLAHQHVVNGHMLTVMLGSNLNGNYIQQNSFQNPVAGLDSTMAFNQYLAHPLSNYAPQNQIPGGMAYGSYTGDDYSNYNQIAMGSTQLPQMGNAPHFQGVPIGTNASTTSYQMPQSNNYGLNQTYSPHAAALPPVTTDAAGTTAHADDSNEQAQLKTVEKLLKKIEEQNINDSSRRYLLKKVENILKKLDKHSNNDVERSRSSSTSRSCSMSISTSYSTSRSQSRSKEREDNGNRRSRSRSKSNRRSRSRSKSYRRSRSRSKSYRRSRSRSKSYRKSRSRSRSRNRGRKVSRNRRSRSRSQKRYRSRSRYHSESRGHRSKVRSSPQRRQGYNQSKSGDKKDFHQKGKRPRSRNRVTAQPSHSKRSFPKKRNEESGRTKKDWDGFWEGIL